MKLRSPFMHLLAALLLLFSQQMAMAHAVSHLADGRGNASREHSLPLDQACNQCLAFAQIDSGLACAGFLHTGAVAGDMPLAAAPHAPRIPALLRAFQPRAPPAFS